MEGTIAEIRLFAGNFAPRNWAFCNGQIISIASNTALFSLLGTTYGGNGTTTFALPNLQGRVAIHAGTGPGLTSRALGESGGSETVTLTAAQMPSHTHTLLPSTGTPNTASPTGAFLPVGSSRIYASAGPSGAALAAGSIGNAGSGAAHENMQPFAAMNYIICLAGIFPSRT